MAEKGLASVAEGRGRGA